MTLPGRAAKGGTRAPRHVANPLDYVLPASRLASVELQQEIAEQLLELGARIRPL